MVQRPPAPDDAVPFVVADSCTLLSTYHFDVVRLSVQSVDDEIELVRDIERHRGTVCVIAVDERGQIPFLRQYRLPVGRWTLELPAGGREEGEAVEVCAARELVEETGWQAAGLELLTKFMNAPGHSTQETYVYLAMDCRPGTPEPVGPEERRSSVVTTTIGEAVKLVATGAIGDAKSIIGVLVAAQRLSPESGG